MVRKLRKESGFTLVELLIVVAIIGVLATVGIPTFKRMMQKSKKAEAKVNLGNLFTTEAAFYSEYGAYGDNLAAMGYEVDGTTSPEVTYRVGFVAAGSAAWGCPSAGNMIGFEPSQANAQAAAASVDLAIPTYHQVYNAQSYLIGSTGTDYGAVALCNGFGRYGGAGGVGNVTTNSLIVSQAAPANRWLQWPKKPADGFQYNGFVVQSDINVGGGSQQDNAFLATAQGVIAGGINKNSPTAGNLDIWSIDDTRTLTNLQDGVL